MEKNIQKEVESEYKALVSEVEYAFLLHHFARIAEASEPYFQTNHYFETKGEDLKAGKTTLRIRLKKGKWQLTAKLPLASGAAFSKNEELNAPLEEKDALRFIQKGIRAEDHEIIAELCEKFGVPEDEKFLCRGSLATLRTDFRFYSDTISLDKNEYGGFVDYELEWETENHGFAALEFARLGISPGNGKSKKSRCMDGLK